MVPIATRLEGCLSGGQLQEAVRSFADALTRDARRIGWDKLSSLLGGITEREEHAWSPEGSRGCGASPSKGGLAGAERAANRLLIRVGLLLVGALILHDVLARREGSSPARLQPLSKLLETPSLASALEKEWKAAADVSVGHHGEMESLRNIPHGLLEAWGEVSILREALWVLDCLHPHETLDRALRVLARAALRVSSSPELAEGGMAGLASPNLVDDQLAKYYGVHYTSPPAARLLAGLAVGLSVQLIRWGIPPLYGGVPLRVADLACGSGVLLTAIYRELASRISARTGGGSGSGRGDDELQLQLHRYLLEEGLWGIDVERRALHLALLNLALQEPRAAVGRFRLYLAPLGAAEGREPSLGSLSLLCSNVLDGAGGRDGGSSAAAIPSFHLIIMNPPFTRSVGGNLIFGGLPLKERKKLRRELRRLMEERGLRGAGHGGLAAAFVALADSYLKEGGRLALVLPKAVLGGVSWRGVRQLLLDRYRVEVVVSSFEGPNGWNFSENTSLSEVLLLASKRTPEMEGDQLNPTLFVNLWRRPRSEHEASLLSSHLLRVRAKVSLHNLEDPKVNPLPLRIGGLQLGEAYTAKLREPDFAHYQLFAQGELNRAAILLRTGTLYVPGAGVAGRIPLAPLNRFVESVGPDVRQVHGAFRVWREGHLDRHAVACSPQPGEALFPALWNHKSTQIRSILQKPNALLKAKMEGAGVSWRLWREGSGQLLVAERAWLTTVRVLSITTTQPVLSNVWWPMRPTGVELSDGAKLNAEQVGKLMALWINSTLGMLLLLSVAEVTRGPWVKFKKRVVSRLPLLDLSQLDQKKTRQLLECYGMVCQRHLRPLPAEFGDPDLRRRIDQSLLQALQLEVELDGLYRLLARDPTITNRPLC